MRDCERHKKRDDDDERGGLRIKRELLIQANGIPMIVLEIRANRLSNMHPFALSVALSLNNRAQVSAPPQQLLEFIMIIYIGIWFVVRSFKFKREPVLPYLSCMFQYFTRSVDDDSVFKYVSTQ